MHDSGELFGRGWKGGRIRALGEGVGLGRVRMVVEERQHAIFVGRVEQRLGGGIGANWRPGLSAEESSSNEANDMNKTHSGVDAAKDESIWNRVCGDSNV